LEKSKVKCIDGLNGTNGTGNADYRTLFENVERAQARLAAQFAVTKTLAETNSLAEAAPEILHAICRTTGWQVGSLWSVDTEANELRCVDAWHSPDTDYSTFVSHLAASTSQLGAGLPGRVWKARKHVWISDQSQEDDLPCSKTAIAAKLKSAFAFPIIWRKHLNGVVAFHSPTILEPDAELLSMTTAIGSMIGQ